MSVMNLIPAVSTLPPDSTHKYPQLLLVTQKMKLKMKTGVETKIEEEEAKFEKQAPVSAEVGAFFLAAAVERFSSTSDWSLSSSPPS